MSEELPQEYRAMSPQLRAMLASVSTAVMNNNKLINAALAGSVVANYNTSLTAMVTTASTAAINNNKLLSDALHAASMAAINDRSTAINAAFASASTAVMNNNALINAALAGSVVTTYNKSLTAMLASAATAAISSRNLSTGAALAGSTPTGASPGAAGYAALVAGLGTSGATGEKCGTWDEFQDVLSRDEFGEVCAELGTDEAVVSRVADVVGAISAGAVSEESDTDEGVDEGATVVEVTNADLVVTAVFLLAMVFAVLTWLHVSHPAVYDYVSKPGGDLLNLVSLLLAAQALRETRDP